MAAWQEHEQLWNEFFAALSGSTKQTSCSDIPWPPSQTVIRHMQEAEIEQLPAMFRRLALRYHPDKLSQRVRKHVTDAEHERISRRACELFKKLNGQYDLLTQ